MDEQTNTVEKMFLAAVALAALGNQPHVKFRGTQEEIDVIKASIELTRAFQEELKRQGASVQDIMNKLSLKQAATEKFTNIFGLTFPV